MTPRGRLFALIGASLLAAGVTVGLPSRAAAGDPVVVGSPAWQALMAVPAEADGAPAFWAADVLGAWGRAAEGTRLQRRLLLRHLQAQAGTAPPPATLGALSDTPLPSHAELLAAQATARQSAGRAGAPWAAEPPADDAAVARLAERVGNRPPPDAGEFMARWGGCEVQGTCPERAARAAQRAASAAEFARRAQQREAELRAESRASQRRGERRWNAMLAAYALGMLLLHLLVARFAGRWVAIAATLLGGVGLAAWLVIATGPQSGWGGLALFIIAAGLACSGLVLAPLYDFIHRRWFARR